MEVGNLHPSQELCLNKHGLLAARGRTGTCNNCEWGRDFIGTVAMVEVGVGVGPHPGAPGALLRPETSVHLHEAKLFYLILFLRGSHPSIVRSIRTTRLGQTWRSCMKSPLMRLLHPETVTVHIAFTAESLSFSGTHRSHRSTRHLSQASPVSLFTQEMAATVR